LLIKDVVVMVVLVLVAMVAVPRDACRVLKKRTPDLETMG